MARPLQQPRRNQIEQAELERIIYDWKMEALFKIRFRIMLDLVNF